MLREAILSVVLGCLLPTQPAPIWVLCPLTPRISVPAPPSQQLRLPLWVLGPLLPRVSVPGASVSLNIWGKNRISGGFHVPRTEGTQRIPCAVGAPGRWEDAGCRARRWVTVTEPRGGGQGGFPGTPLGQGGFVHPPREQPGVELLPQLCHVPFFTLLQCFTPKLHGWGKTQQEPQGFMRLLLWGCPREGRGCPPVWCGGCSARGAGGVLMSQVGAVGTTRLCPPHLSPFSS